MANYKKYDKKYSNTAVGNFRYIPAEPEAPFDTEFHTKNEDGTYSYHLDKYKMVQSIEELIEIKNLCHGKLIAVDTESTGLAYFQDYIVGFSIAISSSVKDTSYYVPIRHKIKTEVSRETVTRLDDLGEVVLTPAGRASKVTSITYEYNDSPYNVDAKKALDIFYEIMLNAKGNLLHNAEFDFIMLQGEGYDTQPIKFYDTMVLTYQIDAESNLKGLKPAEKHYLGRHRPNFEETIGGAENFQFTDPSETTFYAAVDPQSTFGLYEVLKPRLQKIMEAHKDTVVIKGIKYDTIKKDNQLIKAFVEYYSHAQIYIDKQVAVDYKEKVVKDLIELKLKIYDYFKRGTFNLSTSSKEFKLAMEKTNIVTGALTKKGAPSYGKEGLKALSRNLNNLELYLKNEKEIHYADSILDISANLVSYSVSKIIDTYGKDYFLGKYVGNNSYRALSVGKKVLNRKEFLETLNVLLEKERGKYKALKDIQSNSSLNKAVNSYISKLTEVDSCRMRYKLFATKSGRLASGNGSRSDKKVKNKYYIDLNAQNLSKPASCFYRAYKSESERNLVGWKFARVKDSYALSHLETDYIVEGFHPVFNIRDCIVAPKGKIVMSIDYESQEARILALLSQDKIMIDNFLAGIDPHTATAYGIWGKENYNKVIRKKAKMTNFLINYGGGYATLSNNAEIPLDEAKDIVSKYEKVFWQAMAWKAKRVDKMYHSDGIVYTLFGRPRRLGPFVKVAHNNMKEDDSSDMIRKCNGFIKAAERRVASHEIQGLAGDLCRYILIKLYNRYFKKEIKDKDLDFINAVHDEINFYVTNEKETILKYSRDLQDLMKFELPQWQLPLTTSLDLGYSWGNCFNFEFTDASRTVLEPKRVK